MHSQLVRYSLVIAAQLFSFTLMAQHQDYSGTWILNLQKSQLQYAEEGFTGSKFLIRQEGDQLFLTRYHYYGEKQNRIRFKMRADGKTRTIKLLFKGQLQWEGEQLKATLRRKNFLNIVQYRFGDSRDELIADETFTGLPRDHHSIWVFDRADTIPAASQPSQKRTSR